MKKQLLKKYYCDQRSSKKAYNQLNSSSHASLGNNLMSLQGISLSKPEFKHVSSGGYLTQKLHYPQRESHNKLLTAVINQPSDRDSPKIQKKVVQYLDLSPNHKKLNKKSMIETEDIDTKFKNSQAESISVSFSGVGTKRLKQVIPNSFHLKNTRNPIIRVKSAQ